ncbi:hypothetical protein P9230_26690 [Mesorhizobium sp. WSM4887]|nr:hypothetical protein [Mesorhizobium sp. WSM4887]
MHITFAIEPRQTAHLLSQGFGFSSGIATLVLGRLTWALTW